MRLQRLSMSQARFIVSNVTNRVAVFRVTKYLASLPPALLRSRLIFFRRGGRGILTARHGKRRYDNPGAAGLAILQIETLNDPKQGS